MGDFFQFPFYFRCLKLQWSNHFSFKNLGIASNGVNKLTINGENVKEYSYFCLAIRFSLQAMCIQFERLIQYSLIFIFLFFFVDCSMLQAQVLYIFTLVLSYLGTQHVLFTCWLTVHIYLCQFSHGSENEFVWLN